MELNALLSLIQTAPAFQQLRGQLKGRAQLRLGLPDAATAATIAAAWKDLGRHGLVITPQQNHAEALLEELANWLGESSVLHYPERESPPYQRTSLDREAAAQRLHVLSLLQQEEPCLIVASAKAVAQPALSAQELRSASMTVQLGQRLDMEEFLSRLLGMGYQLQPLVGEPGETSRRGGIIDVFPPLAKLPLRLELLGREVESIRYFDPASQRSRETVEQAEIGPAQELLWTDDQAKRAGDLLHGLDFSRCPEEMEERFRRDLGFEGPPSEELYLYQPFLAASTILDHLPDNGLLVLDQRPQLAAAMHDLEEQARTARGEMEERGELPRGLPSPYIRWSDLSEKLDSFSLRLELFYWDEGAEAEVQRLPFRPVPAYGGQLRRLVSELAQKEQGKYKVIISQQAARLSELFSQEGAAPSTRFDVAEHPASLTIVRGYLDGGWRLQDGELDLTLITDREVFGFTKLRRAPPRKAINRDAFLAGLAPGDYVVHIEHGIGRFAGLVRRGVNGHEREYLELHYAEGDKLLVPTDQLDRVSRYIGGGEQQPQLTRLGSGDWQRTKRRIRSAVLDLAQELLELYAARESAQGIAFSPDLPWQQEMEASFPYIETPDQISAIREVKLDMESPRPMDRLVCGDVGYGKTEIALRAAFKAVMDGRQVAVLVPTTVLAQQHLNSFQERLAPFPVRVEMLSRFRSETEQRRIVEDLARGNIDIVIGTHRLLQKDVQFKDLGLVIVDEEQRFGVTHKEHLKRLRSEVDVLTLSATPIPRTLHMALSGIRDISTMETPPEDRLPIKTFVSQFDERLLREAIAREVERGGQVYVVHNRVHNIGLIARKVQQLVPEARVDIAHGQMDERELEQVMADFVAGRVDVLVCTTIIESGLDIPNVNTIVINQADKLGLGQLYQLRGRVGRGAHGAYAYLLYDNHSSLSEVAQKRLQVIFEATELGAGFQIALRDLEIRGAGNLLGPEQSGHIAAVGFDLYCRLLSEAVERLRALQAGEKPAPTEIEIAIDLPLAAHIPASYVSDINQRLALYQRMSRTLELEEVDELAAEIEDRFGPRPPALNELIEVLKLRALARGAGVQSISTQGKQILLRMREGLNVPPTMRKTLAALEASSGQTTIRLELGMSWLEVLKAILKALIKNASEPVAGFA
ncbi:MAG TPA: transcription-repair coupling factor, partial [Dehalococcoidia bacterium]|nr:transcription-repair coupling factor [Dehalococcoidia bacterium]